MERVYKPDPKYADMDIKSPKYRLRASGAAEPAS